MKLPWPFGVPQKPSAASSDDLRWTALISRGFRCASCDQFHHGVFDIFFAGPFTWDGPMDVAPNAAVLDAIASNRNVLTSDFCILDEHRFIRCVLPFFIIGTEMTFNFGVWGSINPAYFRDVVDRFDDGTQDQLGPYFSWLSNTLPGCDEDPAEARMEMQAGKKRPKLYLENESHPFFAKQRDGMTISELFDIYQFYGHDFRQATH